MITTPNPYIVPAAYLEWEKDQDYKHEYIQGEVFAMAGASDEHVTLAGNLFAMLRSHLRGSSCRVYNSDMKVRIESADVFFYPDVLVTCDPRDQNERYFKRYPKLIIEVLSRRTETFDRRRKFSFYRQLESLEEHILVDSRATNVECFRRNDEGLWVLHPYTFPEEVYLKSLDFRCSIEAVYEDAVP